MGAGEKREEEKTTKTRRERKKVLSQKPDSSGVGHLSGRSV